MPRTKFIALLVSCALLSLACVTITKFVDDPGSVATEPNGAESYQATEVPLPVTQPPAENDAFCPDITRKIMKAATSTPQDNGSVDYGSRNDDNATYLVTYSINGDQISDPVYEDVPANLKTDQKDNAKQEEIWNYFSALIPADERGSISEFSIMTDGQDNVLADVAQTRDDPNRWALEVDILDSNDVPNLTYTLVHEFGHVLTLGPSQVPPNLAVFNNPDDENIYLKEVSVCADYFPGEGCSKHDSYINAFYDRFWAGIHEEWNKINLIEDDKTYYDRLDKFYSKYEDQFVNDYAATNPEEDIAESWAYFLLAPKPEGNTIAERKVLFFYDYPELVGLRKQILDNLCVTFPQ